MTRTRINELWQALQAGEEIHFTQDEIAALLLLADQDEHRERRMKRGERRFVLYVREAAAPDNEEQDWDAEGLFPRVECYVQEGKDHMRFVAPLGASQRGAIPAKHFRGWTLKNFFQNLGDIIGARMYPEELKPAKGSQNLALVAADRREPQ